VKQPEQIEHKGVVSSVDKGLIRVAIEVNEACGSCASRKACSMGSSEKREIVVYTTESSNFSVGEAVQVGAKQSLGVVAVLLCYVVPLVVLVGALAVAIAMNCSEGVAALISLGSTALYYAVLYLFRNRISKTVIFTIDKLI
jgi:sigma-E factor negative regulatory protein RseC